MDSNLLFRKKSLENFDNNEKLKKNIKIATPGVLAVIIGICIVAIGFLEWCTLYEIETTQKVLLVKNQANQTECIMHTEFSEYSKISKYKRVYYNNNDYLLNINESTIDYNFIKFSDSDDDIISRGIIEQELNYDNGDKFYRCTVDNLELPTKSAIGYAVVKQENPISYLFNYSWNNDREPQ